MPTQYDTTKNITTLANNIWRKFRERPIFFLIVMFLIITFSLFIFWLFWVVLYYNIFLFADAFSHSISRFIPLNEYILNVISYILFLILIPISILIYSLRSKYRIRGIIYFSILLITYNFLIGLAINNFKIDPVTGAPNKCFFIAGGKVKYYDLVEGQERRFDPISGEPCTPVTQKIARILTRWENGERPNRIEGGAKIDFFDRISGEPSVWYHKDESGYIELYDAEGFHPITSRMLSPITTAVAREWLEQSERERTRRTEARKALEAEQATKVIELAKKKRQDDLRTAFQPSSYRPNTFLIGAIGEGNRLSNVAAKRLLSYLASLPKIGARPVDYVRPTVYQGGYFERLVNGDTGILKEIGLRERIRGAMFARISVECRDSVQKTKSCSVSIKSRLLREHGNGFVVSIREVGVGLSNDQAISNAIELTFKRNKSLTEGLL